MVGFSIPLMFLILNQPSQSMVLFPFGANETITTRKIVLTDDGAILVKNASLAKAQSEITQDVCDCQCNNYTFKFDNTLHGNCLQPYKGALWCYVKDFGQSTCIDRLESSRVSGLFWSFQACGTPKYQDCLGVINRDQDRNNPDRSNDGYDYYEEDDLPDISVFTRTNLRDNQKNGGQIIFGDGQVPNEENDSVNFDSQP